MGFSVINKKNRISLVPGGNNYQKLKSVEDLTGLISKDLKYSIASGEGVSCQSTYNKRFSEQSFNSLSNVSVAETDCSTSSSSVESTDINDIYGCYQPEYTNNNSAISDSSKKHKKHRKRKALSKIFQSFSLNDQLQQSMQCPDWEYYCNKQNYMYNY